MFKKIVLILATFVLASATFAGEYRNDRIHSTPGPAVNQHHGHHRPHHRPQYVQPAPPVQYHYQYESRGSYFGFQSPNTRVYIGPQYVQPPVYQNCQRFDAWRNQYVYVPC